MILGNKNGIDLSISSFKNMRKNNNLYVDKTKFIENFLNESNSVQLVVRQRRLGKSLNLDMVKCFLTDKEDNRNLFRGTYIENSAVWEYANSNPIFLFDFKNLTATDYKKQIFRQIDQHISTYVDESTLPGYLKRAFEDFMNNYGNTEGLLLLTKLVYHSTGKHSYILIDEYDKLLTDNYDTEFYDEIKNYETHLLSAGLKGNEYLKKALLTGVMRVSRESILSGLNNLVTYDVFLDDLYTSDFGLMEFEIDELQNLTSFDKTEIRKWYNGVKINEKEIYNIYSVLCYLKHKKFENYWGRSGTTGIIVKLMNESRKESIIKLLNHETIEVFISRRISLHELNANPSDNVFYSLLVQTGYLSLERINTNNLGIVKIPNKELMNVWKEFVLSSIVNDEIQIKTLFDHSENLTLFDRDLECFLGDRLSYFDLAENDMKTKEKIYHVFVLGLLSAYEDISFKKPPISNRESGDGRYDILFERKDFTIIFEFKSVENASQLVAAAEDGLRQIDEKRYYADAPKDKPLIKTAIAFCGKQCSVKSSRHEWHTL